MHRWRQVGIAVGICAAGLLSLAAVLQFLAPSLSYQIKDRVAESFSGQSGRKFRIALGAAKGSYYLLGVVLNRHLKEKAGYELELVATAAGCGRNSISPVPSRNLLACDATSPARKS